MMEMKLIITIPDNYYEAYKEIVNQDNSSVEDEISEVLQDHIRILIHNGWTYFDDDERKASAIAQKLYNKYRIPRPEGKQVTVTFMFEQDDALPDLR
jgi:hypothetical protein